MTARAFGAYSIAKPAPPPPTTSVAAITKNSAEGVIGEEFDSHLSKRSFLFPSEPFQHRRLPLSIQYLACNTVEKLA